MTYTNTTTLLKHFQVVKRQISTDTRKIRKGDLFFALKGANFNGNRFADQALANGAAYVVVDEPEVVKDDRYLLVEDVLAALQNLATAYRRYFDIPVLAITGSNGKTTTKELIAAVLDEAHHTHFTQGNFNNHIGVPLTLLAMPPETEIAVIEMGANHQGEIAELCKIAEPTHGLVTNVGMAHLEGFGGVEGVRKGKSELYAYLAQYGGVGFINEEESHLCAMAEERGLKRFISYQLSHSPSKANPNFEIKLLALQPHLQVQFLAVDGSLHLAESTLSGPHNLQNLITAIAIGKYFKVPARQIVAGIASYVPTNNRSQRLTYREVHFYLDAYNANPSSMRAALQHFAQEADAPRIAILGDMLELGEYTEAEHRAIAELAVELKLEEVILVGPIFAALGPDLQLPHYEDTITLKSAINWSNWEGNNVLVKGSRGIGLEKLIAD